VQTTDIMALTDTYPMANLSAAEGRVAVLGQQPLLEAELAANGAHRLLLYSVVGANIRLDHAAALLDQTAWQPWQTLVPSQQVTTFENVLPGSEFEFLRAVRLP
jgi:hypothetical protein